MSRAFINDKDDWRYCIEKQEKCMFAGEDGKCALEKCKYDDDK